MSTAVCIERVSLTIVEYVDGEKEEEEKEDRRRIEMRLRERPETETNREEVSREETPDDASRHWEEWNRRT